QWAGAFAFSGDGSRVVAADSTGSLWQCDTASGQPVGASIRHTQGFNSVAVSADGSVIAGADYSGAVYVWSANTGESLGPAIKNAAGAAYYYLALSPNGGRLAISEVNGIRLWDVRSRKDITRLPLPSAIADVAPQLMFSPDGSRLMMSAKTLAMVMDISTGKLLGPPMRHGGTVLGAVFHPTSGMVATCDYDKTVRVWNPATGLPVGPALMHDKGLGSVAFSSDGEVLAAADYYGSTRLWDVRTGEPLAKLIRTEEGMPLVHFGPSGRSVLIANLGTAVVNVVDTTWLQREMSPDDLLLRVRVATVKRINRYGFPENLPLDEWRGLRERLAAVRP
ncbi:MAG: hypothetical protein AAB368_09410, partial [bacterium]